MSDEREPPASPAVPSEPKAAHEAYQRRAARAIGFLLLFGALVWLPVFWFTVAKPGSWDDFLLIEGLMLGPAWALLLYWRTGHDPKGYSKPLFGGRPPTDPK